MAKHVAEHHPGHETKLRCATCCAEFSNARSAGRHKCAGVSAPTNEVATVWLTEDSAIYEYLPGPSQCPLCTWVSQAKDTAAVTSVEKHLMRIHQRNKPKRLWRCRICNTIADGIKMRTHVCDTQGEPSPSPTPAQPTTPTPTNEEADRSPARCTQPPEGEDEFSTPSNLATSITTGRLSRQRQRTPCHAGSIPTTVTKPFIRGRGR